VYRRQCCIDHAAVYEHIYAYSNDATVPGRPPRHRWQVHRSRRRESKADEGATTFISRISGQGGISAWIQGQMAAVPPTAARQLFLNHPDAVGGDPPWSILQPLFRRALKRSSGRNASLGGVGRTTRRKCRARWRGRGLRRVSAKTWPHSRRNGAPRPVASRGSRTRIVAA